MCRRIIGLRCITFVVYDYDKNDRDDDDDDDDEIRINNCIKILHLMISPTYKATLFSQRRFA